jgi:hypothetical protein
VPSVVVVPVSLPETDSTGTSTCPPAETVGELGTLPKSAGTATASSETAVSRPETVCLSYLDPILNINTSSWEWRRLSDLPTFQNMLKRKADSDSLSMDSSSSDSPPFKKFKYAPTERLEDCKSLYNYFIDLIKFFSAGWIFTFPSQHFCAICEAHS